MHIRLHFHVFPSFQVRELKEPLLRKAALELLNRADTDPLKAQMNEWVEKHPWVEDSALFEVIRHLPQHKDKVWYEWEEGYKLRKPEVLDDLRKVGLGGSKTWLKRK